MACQDRNIPGDVISDIGLGVHSSHSGIDSDIKEEMEEDGDLTGIKVEHDALDGYGMQEMISVDIAGKWYNLEDDTNIHTEELIKNESKTFTSDAERFQPVVIKIEDDDCESKYNDEDRYMTWGEGTSSRRNTGNNVIKDDDDGAIKTEDDDREFDELTSQSYQGVTNWEGDEEFSAWKPYRTKTQQGKCKTLDCIKYGKKLLSKFYLDDHIVTWHSDDAEVMKTVTSTILRCERCGYMTIKKLSMASHMRKHGRQSERNYDCVKCERRFLSKCHLHKHMATWHSDDLGTMKIHRCKRCGYKTNVVKKLIQHMRRHKEETFDCIKCEMKFLSRYQLDKHIVKEHSENGETMNRVSDKIHRCKYCNYVTDHVNHLMQHMTTHDSRFKEVVDCIKCKKKFLNKYHLDNHIVTWHSDSVGMMNYVTCIIHRCECCSYMTVDADSFTQHMRTHQEEMLKR